MADLNLCKKILADLVSFPTVSGRPNADIITYIQDYLLSHGIESVIDTDEAEGLSNILATIGPNIDGGVALSGHTDVVPADPTDWTTDPYELREADGKLYGRGSVDMKGFLAMALASVPDYKAVEDQLKHPLQLVFTYDEETGSFGAERLPEFYKKGLAPLPAIAIVGEPTSMIPVTGHKGGYEMRTEFYGKAGHASTPNVGANAVYAASRFVNYLADRAEALAANPIAGSPFDPPHTSISVGIIKGGEARNIIPDRASVTWELRPLPEDDADAMVTEIHDWAKANLEPMLQAKGGRIEFNEVSYPGMIPKEDSAAASLVARLWTNAEPIVVSFGTDGCYIQKAGIDTIVFGPGSLAQAHQPDEYIDISDLQIGLDFLARLKTELIEN